MTNNPNIKYVPFENLGPNERAVINSTDTVFTGSKCLFVEYMDLIRCPWYVLLMVITQNEKMKTFIKTEKIEYMDRDQLFEWYCRRENKNFLLDLARTGPAYETIDFDKILDFIITSDKMYFEVDTKLNMCGVIAELLRTKVCDKIIVWTPEPIEYVYNDLELLFFRKDAVGYYYGDFKDTIKKLPTDITYFFSDITHVIDLEEIDRLNMASIAIPYEYDYNFIMDSEGNRKPVIDLDYFAENNVFKINYFNAIPTTDLQPNPNNISVEDAIEFNE